MLITWIAFCKIICIKKKRQIFQLQFHFKSYEKERKKERKGERKRERESKKERKIESILAHEKNK